MVLRAVERPSGSLTETAGGGIRIAEQPQLRLFVRRAALLKYFCPHLLRAAEDLRHELRLRVAGGGRLTGLVGSGGLHAGATTTQEAEDLQRIDAKDPSADECDHDRAESDAMDRPEAAAGATDVFDVLAFALIIHSHM